MKLGGQLRVSSGMSIQVLGWDMSAALALADALGIDRYAVAELLPDVEQVAIEKMNQELRQGDA